MEEHEEQPPKRLRSRSPPKREPKTHRGFRWKDTRPRDGDDNDRGRDDRRNRRERSRSPRRDSERFRDRGRDSDRYRDRDGDRGYNRSYDRYRDSDRGYGWDQDRDRQRERDDEDRYRPRDRDDDRHRPRDQDDDRPRSPRRDADKADTPKEGKEESGQKSNKKQKKPKAAPVGAGQELIVVNVNDRLGTKTAVPCLPSDTVGQFKLMIAARIGRDAGQIMLRRQGERPFKDMITLEDYGISNGVQLDLEIDTGD